MMAKGLVCITSRTFIVKTILNNNAVLVEDPAKKESVIYAKGIGFHTNKGDVIKPDTDFKEFVILDNDYKDKLFSILDEIPFDCIELTQNIINYAESKLNQQLNPSLLFTLSDHINFSVKRYRDAIDAPSMISAEMKRFYQKEYQIGITALKMINEHYHIHLNETEAGAIAFHLVTAQQGSINVEARKILFGVKDIVSITEGTLGIQLDENSIDYSRYVVHLKYFLKSILVHNSVESTTIQHNGFLYALISKNNVKIQECLTQIGEYTERIFNYKLTDDDKTYLTVHLMRLCGYR